MRSSFLFVSVVTLALANAARGQISIVDTQTLEGTVESVSPSGLVVKDADGKAQKLLIQPKDEETVTLGTGQRLRFAATVRVTGEYSADSLERGKQIRFSARLNRLGASDGTVSEIWLVSDGDRPPGVTVVEAGATPADFSKVDLVGEVSRLANDRLIVNVPRSELTRKTVLAFQLADDAKVLLESDDFRRAGAGSRVKVVVCKLDTGDMVIRELEVDVSEASVTARSVDERLLVKYRHLSDDPQPPHQIRSAHFAFMTDISERQSRILLDKLETMVTLLSVYFGRQPSGLIQGFIVRDLSQWPDGVLIEPQGVAKIQSNAGICFSRTLGNQAEAIIYACDDHGVVQHEATHAYCTMAFGGTGPTWLAEGVAELGQYWKADQKAVDISPSVVNYIRQSSPKKTLLEIAVPGRVPAGDWRDYAWRWALCYLLANNPNYADRFKPLAVALMKGQENVSFESVYGPVAKEISFEYDLFLETFDNGYRADLCAWQWGRPFKPLAQGARAKATASAQAGWQATGVRVEEGKTYDVAAVGTWKIADDGDEYSANGDTAGRGRLVGVVFRDYKLSAPIELSERATFVAPVTGDLFVRCQDDWTKLEDNGGELTVHFRLAEQ